MFMFGPGSRRIVVVSKTVTSLFGFLITTLYFWKEYPAKNYILCIKYILPIKAYIYCVLAMCQTPVINSLNPATTPWTGAVSLFSKFQRWWNWSKGSKVTYQSFSSGIWWNRDSNLRHLTPESVVSVITFYWLSITYQRCTWIYYISQQIWQKLLHT